MDNKNNILVIIICILLIYIMCGKVKNVRVYSNNNRDIINKIKELEIVFLKLSSCPYCIKMESLLLSKDLLRYMHTVDVRSTHGKQIAQANNATGFPSFISNKTKKMTSGYTEDINKLIHDLE